MFLFIIIIIIVVVVIIIIIIIIIKYERHWSVHIKLCPILRLAKTKTMVDSNLVPWEFAPDPWVILVLLWDKVGRLSVVTIFTLPLPHAVVISRVWFRSNTSCGVRVKQGTIKPWKCLAVLDNIRWSSLVKILAIVSVRWKCKWKWKWSCIRKIQLVLCPLGWRYNKNKTLAHNEIHSVEAIAK